MNKFLLSGASLLVPLLALGGCVRTAPGGPSSSTAPGTPGTMPLAVVSILPQGYFAGRIAGERGRVMVLAGPGQNPHNYEASPRQMAELAGASFWVLSGTEFEIALRPRIAALFPRLSIVDGTEGIRWRSLEAHDDGEDDPDDPDHAGGGLDRHSWLGREPALILARRITEAFCGADPENAPWYRSNGEALIRDIEDEFDRLREELAPLRGRTVFVYHPAFGYFLDEFGLVQEAVETGGKEPTPRALNRLIEKARAEGAAAIFVQAQFPLTAAKTVAAAAGAELAALDPLAADWLANIRAMGEALKGAAFGEVNHEQP